MAQVKIRDQHGNPPPAPCDRLNVLLTPHGTNEDGATWDGTPKDDKFTDNAGNLAFVGWGVRHLAASGGFTLQVNAVNVNPHYGVAERHVSSLEQDVEIVVTQLVSPPTPPPPGPITGTGTCEEWRKAVFAIFAKHGYTTVGPDNEGQGVNQAPHLRVTLAEIKALHPSPFVQWQFESGGTPLELRPRLFLPHGGSDPYARYADIGSWDGPLKWEHCQ